MSDILLRKLRAQVTIAMDATLRRAAFEIMTIFENTLSDQKRELVEKEEVVAQLRLKLQVAELRLKDLQGQGPSTVATNQTQAIPEIIPDVPKMIHVEKAIPKIVPDVSKEVPVEKKFVAAPEIDFEVPDDWCAPLGTEHVPKQEEAFCPSVRLREFSIPLFHVPIVKKESVDDFGSPQKNSGCRSSPRRRAGEGEMPKALQTGELHGKGSRMQKEIQLLFKQLKQEDFIDMTTSGLRKSRRLEEGEMKKKPFQCTNCPKRFRRTKALEKHQERRHKIKGKPDDINEDLGWTQPLEDVEDNLQVNDVVSQDSRPNTKPQRVGKKRRKVEALKNQTCGVRVKEGYRCSVCQKLTKHKYTLEEHFRIHTGEKPHRCDVCSKNFRFRSQLSAHLKIKHKSEPQQGKQKFNSNMPT